MILWFPRFLTQILKRDIAFSHRKKGEKIFIMSSVRTHLNYASPQKILFIRSPKIVSSSRLRLHPRMSSMSGGGEGGEVPGSLSSDKSDNIKPQQRKPSPR